MADNVTIGSAVGTVAADEVTDGSLGTVKVQYVKLMDGTLDGTNKSTVNAAGLAVNLQDLPAATGTITAQDIVSTTATGQGNQSIITGTPTAASTVSQSFSGNTSFAIQVTGTWTGTLLIERSLDGGTTWTDIAAFAAGTNAISKSITSNGSFHGNASGCTNIRVRSSAAMTGTGAVVRILSGEGVGTITMSSAVRGEYLATAPTLADRGTAALQLDVQGNQKQSLATRLDPINDGVTSYPFGHSYTNITTNATTTIKTGSGFLHSIKINNPSVFVTTAVTVTIYDNTAGSGTLIGTLTIPFGQAGAMPFDIDYESAFTTGLTIVTSGTTAPNLTVEWR